MRQNQKHVQDLESDRRNRQEVHRHQRGQVIVKERPPDLGGWLSVTDQVFADNGLTDADAELQQFAMNVRSSPQRIFAAHRADQLANLFWHCRPAGPAAANLPAPKQTKALAMPANDSGGP
jgi:hypothetical protein